MFAPITVGKDEQAHKLKLINGSVVDFWSIEGIESMRGSKYNRIFWDEAAHDKKLEEHYNYIVAPTLLDFNGGVDFISTPKGHNYYKILDERSRENPKWASFHYTTYDNPLIPKEAIDEMVLNMSSIVAQQEVYAEYVDLQGALIHREWLRYKQPTENLDVYMAFDLAISEKETADFTAGIVIGVDKDRNIYVLDVIREKLSFHQQEILVNNLYEKWHPITVGIESVQYQLALFQEIVRKYNMPVRRIDCPGGKGGKVARFQPIVAKYERGLIYHTPGLPQFFENELLAFPESEHDDMCDALAHAVSLSKVKQSLVLSW